MDQMDAIKLKRLEADKIREAATLIGYNAHRVITLHYLGGKPIRAKVSVELLDD